MFYDWFNSIICDQSKAAFVSVFSFISGMFFKVTGTILTSAGPFFQPEIEHIITVVLMWLSFSCGILVSIMTLISKCRNWNTSRKHKKELKQARINEFTNFEDF